MMGEVSISSNSVEQTGIFRHIVIAVVCLWKSVPVCIHERLLEQLNRFSRNFVLTWQKFDKRFRFWLKLDSSNSDYIETYMHFCTHLWVWHITHWYILIRIQSVTKRLYTNMKHVHYSSFVSLIIVKIIKLGHRCTRIILLGLYLIHCFWRMLL